MGGWMRRWPYNRAVNGVSGCAEGLDIKPVLDPIEWGLTSKGAETRCVRVCVCGVCV